MGVYSSFNLGIKNQMGIRICYASDKSTTCVRILDQFLYMDQIDTKTCPYGACRIFVLDKKKTHLDTLPKENPQNPQLCTKGILIYMRTTGYKSATLNFTGDRQATKSNSLIII